jgi:hypothetical protein
MAQLLMARTDPAVPASVRLMRAAGVLASTIARCCSQLSPSSLALRLQCQRSSPWRTIETARHAEMKVGTP